MAAVKGRRGFTVIEAAVALLLVTLMVAGMAVPLAAQVQQRRQDETRRLLEDARDALMGFAAANGRLPCPATAASGGLESFAPTGSPANGDCETFYGGFLPAATLGLAPLDSEGFLRDPWLTPRNRVRYAVFGGGAAINGVANPLTRANGLQAATLPALGNAAHFLFICSSGAQATASGCPAANQLTRRAAFVVFSAGANARNDPPPGSDEARNLDGDGVFVHRDASSVPGQEFDDVLLWTPIHLVVSRLLAAGRLP